jgi:UDP-N-acetylmuramoyl-L-alanyl-D-glutamate--2,6-diaminopimelate ligase
MNFATMRNNDRISQSIRLSRLFEGINISIPAGSEDLKIDGIAADSRMIQPGDLFIAIPGHSQDGRKYIPEAVSLGAVAILTVPGRDVLANIPVIIAENLNAVIPEITNRFYDYPSRKIKIAGVTGTNGKTTTIHLISAIFRSIGEKWGRIGTIGYDTGSRTLPSTNTTPGPVDIQKLIAEMVKNGLNGCAMEVSSHALDQGRCNGIKFHSATFTNLTQDHLDYHENMEKYFLAKAKLFENVERSIINVDDQYGKKLMNQMGEGVVSYGFREHADLECKAVAADIESSTLEFEYKGQSVQFDFPLPGIFNHLNAAAAAATGLAYGLSLREVTNGLSKAKAVPGRMQSISLGQPFGVYVDYAHTPDALKSLLESVKNFKANKIHIVFGCGGDRDAGKRPLMARAASESADLVYLTSDNPRTEDPQKIIKDALAGITDKKRCRVIEDRALAIRTAITSAEKGDIVVIAGKGHEEYQVSGTVRKFFSDIEAAKSELRKLGYESDG